MKRALLCLLFVACTRAETDDPVEAYQLLLRNIQRNEVKAAFAGLSAQTRQLLNERSQALARASDGGVRDDAPALFFAQLERPSSLSDIALAERDAGTALLKVASTAGGASIRMVKEEGGWKLDLTATLK